MEVNNIVLPNGWNHKLDDVFATRRDRPAQKFKLLSVLQVSTKAERQHDWLGARQRSIGQPIFE